MKRLKEAILVAFWKEHPQLARAQQATAVSAPVEDYRY